MVRVAVSVLLQCFLCRLLSCLKLLHLPQLRCQLLLRCLDGTCSPHRGGPSDLPRLVNMHLAACSGIQALAIIAQAQWVCRLLHVRGSQGCLRK